MINLRALAPWLAVPLAACTRQAPAPAPPSDASASSPASSPPATPNPATSASSFFSESFAGASSLDAWKQVDGSIDGNGPPSTLTLDDGGVRLQGDGTTRHWRALERTVPLKGTTWVKVSARMRTDGLVPDATHRPQCYVYLRFVDASGKRVGDLLTTRNVLGTTPWTAVTRRFKVPDGAASVTTGLFVSLPGSAWFDDVELDASAAPTWLDATTGHYHYHWLGGDQVPDDARAYNSESYRIAAAFLGVDPSAPDASAPASVQYFKYADKAIKEELMGDNGNAYTLPDGTMHSIFATDRHEIVHVLARAWGHPPAFMAEGLAVYLSGAWQGQPVTTYAKALVDHGWISLAGLLESQAFRLAPDLATYPIVGSLVEWVVAQPNGKDTLRVLYGKIANDAPSADSRRIVEALLGATVEEIDTKLREWLRAK